MYRKITLQEQLREERGNNLKLQNENIVQGVELSEREINEIIIAMQVSDLEIQIMELGGI